MPSSSPVALIFGAGANVGQNVGRAFAAKGYNVAYAARSLKEEDSSPTQLNIRSDFADPASIADTFAKVNSHFGPPHVVVYNAAAATLHDAADPLGLALTDFARSFDINTTSAFVAAQQAALGFQQLPETASRTFIYTGNCLNGMYKTTLASDPEVFVSPIIALMDCGVGKSATAHIIQCAAEAYKEKGFKFYYADERNADGSPAYHAIDGPAHAVHYTELAEGTSQGPWQQTFVKGLGYKKF